MQCKGSEKERRWKCSGEAVKRQCCTTPAGASSRRGRSTARLAPAATEDHMERQCLSRGGSGNPGQGRCLSREGSGSTRKGSVLAAAGVERRQWKHRARAVPYLMVDDRAVLVPGKDHVEESGLSPQNASLLSALHERAYCFGVTGEQSPPLTPHTPDTPNTVHQPAEFCA